MLRPKLENLTGDLNVAFFVFEVRMAEDNIFYIASPKDKDYENGKNNLTTIYMRSKEKLYGTLRFNCMILEKMKNNKIILF